MTKAQIRRAATAIFNMRVNCYTKPSQAELNQRRIAIRKKIEERQFNSLLAALARDEAAA